MTKQLSLTIKLFIHHTWDATSINIQCQPWLFFFGAKYPGKWDMHFPFQEKNKTISSYIQSFENFSHSQQGPPWFSATPRWPSPPPLPPPLPRRWNLGNRRKRGGVWRSQRSRDLRRSKPDNFVGLMEFVNWAMNKNLGCLRFVGDYDILSSLGSIDGLVGLIGLFDWFGFGWSIDRLIDWLVFCWLVCCWHFVLYDFFFSHTKKIKKGSDGPDGDDLLNVALFFFGAKQTYIQWNNSIHLNPTLLHYIL